MTRLMMCALLLAACGKTDKADKADDKAAPKPNTPSSGATTTWKGTWTRTQPPNMPGGGAMTLTVPDGGGMGTVTAETSLCIKPNTPIKVTVTGGDVAMQVDAGETHATYTAKIDGTKMTGEATVTCAPGTGQAKFELTKQ